MTRDKPKSATSPFAHITDPALREKLEAVNAEHMAAARCEEQRSTAPKRFAFSRQTPNREIGGLVRVRCALDEEPRGGTIREKIGPAYLVEVDGVMLTVWEPDDCWESI